MQAYRAARRAAFSQSTARLQQMFAPAVSTLGKIMLDSKRARREGRVRAAASILDLRRQGIADRRCSGRLSDTGTCYRMR